MSVSELLAPFRDPEAVARYTEGPRRFVPGVADMHTMTGLLFAEHAPTDARVLVLGAGGGLELKALADMHAGWTFNGVDPAPEMLALAQRTVGVHATRVRLREGLIDVAPDGPFDAATCLLTLHFLAADERTQWLSRYAAFTVASGADKSQIEKMHAAVETHLNLHSPEDDEAILLEAGFSNVSVFYAAFTWRGWVAYA